jgi:hypothetical protein
MTTCDSELRRPPRTSCEGLANGNGHLEKLRHDPIGLVERVESLVNERIHIRAEVGSGFHSFAEPVSQFEFGCDRARQHPSR